MVGGPRAAPGSMPPDEKRAPVAAGTGTGTVLADHRAVEASRQSAAVLTDAMAHWASSRDRDSDKPLRE